MIQPVNCLLRFPTFLLLPFFLAWCPFPAAGEEANPGDMEVLFGTYVYTDRNLETQGATFAFRYWFLDPESGFSLFYPHPLSWGLEGRGGFLTSPDTGWEGAAMLNLRYDLGLGGDFGVYAFLGAGGSYTSIDYTRSTNWNFILRTGLGLRFQGFLLQAAVEHRSNAGLSSFNRGLDVLTAAAGFRF